MMFETTKKGRIGTSILMRSETIYGVTVGLSTSAERTSIILGKLAGMGGATGVYKSLGRVCNEGLYSPVLAGAVRTCPKLDVQTHVLSYYVS